MINIDPITFFKIFFILKMQITITITIAFTRQLTCLRVFVFILSIDWYR